MTILDKLKKYFEETPREQVLKDWEETKEATKNVDSPTIEQFLLYGVSKSFYCYKETSRNLRCPKPCMLNGKCGWTEPEQ